MIKKILNNSFKLLLIFSLLISLTSCDINGNYTCKTCKDKSEITCTSCRGKKHIKCLDCKGKGTKTCSLCNGSGRHLCSSCGGTGSRYEYDFFSKKYTYKICFSCTGGYKSCLTSTPCYCSSGKKLCTLCNENAKIDCPNC